jgi:hypothetical protein
MSVGMGAQACGEEDRTAQTPVESTSVQNCAYVEIVCVVGASGAGAAKARVARSIERVAESCILKKSLVDAEAGR